MPEPRLSRKTLGIASLLAGLAVSGCAQPPSAATPPTSAPAPARIPGAAGGARSLPEVVAAARADAARRTGLPAESLVLVDAQAVTWSDGSLGCPQPGMNYTMALVRGYRVRLRGPAGVLDYHAGSHGSPVLCPAERSVDPVGNLAI